jgi:hypothetical protein
MFRFHMPQMRPAGTSRSGVSGNNYACAISWLAIISSAFTIAE